MKKVVIVVGKPSKLDKNGIENDNPRESTVRKVANVISDLPEKGSFQVVISNKETKREAEARNLKLGLRVLCGAVEKHAKKQGKEFTASDAYFFCKRKFAVPIARSEDNALDFQFRLMNDHLKRSKISKEEGNIKMTAMIHAVISLNKMSNEGLNKLLIQSANFWADKGVKV